MKFVIKCPFCGSEFFSRETNTMQVLWKCEKCNGIYSSDFLMINGVKNVEKR